MRRLKFVLAVLFMAGMIGCGGNQQPKSYVQELTSDDSLTIRMGQWDLLRFHSDKLDMDINYPSFLYYQDLQGEPSQELFMYEDISVSVMVDSMRGMNRSASQQMLAMGADLVDVGDDYSIMEGSEDAWDYYGKMLENDSLRLVTIMLRYNPKHTEAVEALKEWVRNFTVR